MVEELVVEDPLVEEVVDDEDEVVVVDAEVVVVELGEVVLVVASPEMWFRYAVHNPNISPGGTLAVASVAAGSCTCEVLEV